MVDKIRPIKIESSTSGGTQDDFNYTEVDPTEDYVDAKGVTFETSDGHRIDRSGGGEIQFTDPVNGTKTLGQISTSTGITEPQHAALDYLGHMIAETSFDEIIRTGSIVDQVITWTSAAKTTKVRESIFTRSSGFVTQVVTNQYDGAGVVSSTITEVINRTGPTVNDITRTLT